MRGRRRRMLMRHLRLLLDQPCFCRIGDDGRPSRLCNFHNRQQLRVQELERALDNRRCWHCASEEDRRSMIA